MMPGFLFQGTFLFGSLMLVEVNSQECRTGWFGEECTFQCHCAKSDYCGLDGKCPNNENCKTGYFGTGCQYVDLAYTLASPSTAKFLYDNDDLTCNPDVNAMSVRLTLTNSMPASWFRIVVKEFSELLSFTLAINQNYACANEKRHIVNSFIVDVVCDEGFMLKDLLIKGKIASTICSVYISGGRNVALYQFANQTSTYRMSSVASNSVDGSTDKIFDRGSCSRTNSGVQPRWTLYFKQPQRLLRALLYNSDANTLHGFTVRTYSSKGVMLVSRTDTSTQPQPVYDMTLISPQLVVKLEVIGTNDYPRKPNALHFCEIEVYGDYLCPRGKHGLDCSKMCSCGSISDACNQITGVCTPTCPRGRFGHQCTQFCSVNCYARNCEAQSGVCYYCNKGYSGEYCALVTDEETRKSSFADSQMGKSFMWSLIPLSLIVFTMPVAIYVCTRRKTTTSQQDEDGNVAAVSHPS